MANDLSIVAPTLDREDYLDALVETVDGLVRAAQNAFPIAVTAVWTPTLNRPIDASRQAELRERLVNETNLRLRLRIGEPITPQDVLSCVNQTLKHQALVQCGYERFVEELGSVTIDTDGDDSLILIRQGDKQRPIVFVYVKDATGDKRYLLRVPPDMRRVRQAIAWTFGLSEREYKPSMET